MCTVTFIPSRDSVILTSNRDEKKLRPDALTPAVYPFASGNLLFPKDAMAGGTWIAAHENGNAIVFLNGAWVAHQPNPPYRKSRGQILLDLIEGASPYNSFLAIKLTAIEPFTAVVFDDGQLFECRWDGDSKHALQLNETQPHIWSSATLYNETVINKRKGWFDRWMQDQPNPSQEAILHFHQFTGDGDTHNDLRMNRNDQLFTVSVTSLLLTPVIAQMQYLDLKNNSSSTSELLLEKTMASR